MKEDWRKSLPSPFGRPALKGIWRDHKREKDRKSNFMIQLHDPRSANACCRDIAKDSKLRCALVEFNR